MADKKISALTGATTPLVGTEVLPIVQSGATVKVSVASLTTGRSPTMNYAMMQNGIIVQNSSVNRWIIHREASALDDLYIYRYTDAGVLAGIPVQISRSTGNVRLEGNVIQGTAAKGVNFTANTPAAGMTSQLLNWYEEGTFTPTLTTNNVNFTSVTYDTATGGRYIRVGRVVHIQMYLRTDAVTVGSASGDVLIGGLPFTAVANSGAPVDGNSSLAVSRVSDWTTDQPNAARVNANSTQIELYKRATSNGASANVAVANVGTGANLNTIYLAGTYIAA